eukprot:3356711-Rhodomonas_salina.2
MPCPRVVTHIAVVEQAGAGIIFRNGPEEGRLMEDGKVEYKGTTLKSAPSRAHLHHARGERESRLACVADAQCGVWLDVPMWTWPRSKRDATRLSQRKADAGWGDDRSVAAFAAVAHQAMGSVPPYE